MANDEKPATGSIPLPLFFGKSQKDQVRISPLGKWLGWRARDKGTGVLNLWVQQRIPTSKLGQKRSQPRQVTFEKDRDVCLLYWFSCDDETLIYLREPQNGSELYHLYAIDLHEDDDKDKNRLEVRDLIQDPGTTCAMGFAGGLQVWFDPENPRFVYTSTAPCGIRSLFWNISRVHLDTCESKIVQQNPLSTWPGLVWFALCSMASLLLRRLSIKEFHPRAPVQWFPDQKMNFRGRLEISLQNLSCAWRVQEDGPDWKLLHCVEWKDANMSLVGSSGGSGTAHFDFSHDGRTVDLHVCNRGDTTSYERYDILSGDHVAQLACHAKSDITGFILHPKTREVQGVQYNYEKPTIVCLDSCIQEDKNDIEYLQQHFQGGSCSIVNRTLDDQTWVFFVQSDNGIRQCGGCPGAYFLFYRKSSSDATHSLELEVSPQPDFAHYGLATMTPVHIPTRDGEDLLCYLSTPPAEISQKVKTPLVLLIHGGPQARDVWEFDPLCQLLCNRGMSVLQVNYRGSTGLGSRFVKIGMDGAFAKELQEDIQDAAQFAIEQKWCEFDQIAIMGASFGGYCSLAAVTFMADTECAPNFQCAVAICPPTIFGAANPHKAFYGNPLIARYWKQVFGPAISSDVKESKKVSPLFHMEKARKPILLLHGEDDPRVPIEQSNQAALMMSVPGSEYVRFGKEGHGIQKEQNILYMYHRIERFLCRHLHLLEPSPLEASWTDGNTATSVPLGLDESSCKDKKA